MENWVTYLSSNGYSNLRQKETGALDTVFGVGTFSVVRAPDMIVQNNFITAQEYLSYSLMPAS